jgi:hypothetical protein
MLTLKTEIFAHAERHKNEPASARPVRLARLIAPHPADANGQLLGRPIFSEAWQPKPVLAGDFSGILSLEMGATLMTAFDPLRLLAE